MVVVVGEGLVISEGYLRLRFMGLIFGDAYDLYFTVYKINNLCIRAKLRVKISKDTNKSSNLVLYAGLHSTRTQPWKLHFRRKHQ